MAAATINSYRETVAGSTRVLFYNADISDTNTITTSLKEVLAVDTNLPAKCTSIIVTIVAGVAVLTFAVTSGPAAATRVRVEGL